MFPKELIGKKAIRTEPNCQGDHSLIDEPIFIAKATESHIVYTYPKENMFSRIISDQRPRILDRNWIDDKWTDYEALMSDLAVDPDKPINEARGPLAEEAEDMEEAQND
jgi:hypothetical protein